MANTIEVAVAVNDNIQYIAKKTVAQVVDEVGLQAVETEFLNGALAGTAVASKTLVLGADKNVDTLSFGNNMWTRYRLSI